ncbi:putative Xre family DNA-binding protein [Nocardia brasiliensis NBRC 14402]|uniref:helix-turn-helix domain-containing protein n=1 Tax=Nocardia brasiliensis TaxID=37326 RepID=UPI00045D462C|nr:helix-turn-helix transcriptional regulator [Nocardia brasiliensis]ASF10911.1 XRE family transcriptional regulator [Nocardia brasiliensis]GAJ83639.1 putative Xre family DNA-binding protein [Nocardia brasiliensis NBRC 14402]SUB10453.1 Predicted transcriptional regulator [Nocardia brasiliensis]
MSSPGKPPLNPTAAAFGARVRARRAELGWSQEVAAHACGVHWTYLGQVERGRRSPRVENIVKFATGLGTTPGRLMDGLPVPSADAN